jgi:hypothetical protein
MPNIDQVQLPDGSQYNLKDNVSNYVTAGYVDDAIDALTKADVGLGNVDNTSDLNKPVSTAQQTALNGKTDTTVIAPTETTTTASRRYEIGEQFILSGVLYTATAVIASGDTIIVDTNCALSESITEQIANVDLSALANKSDLTSISESGTTASQAISAGTYFYLNGTLCYAITNIASGATFTLNTNYEVVTAGALNDLVLKSTVVTLPNLTLSNSGYVSISAYKPSDVTPIFAIFENFDGLSSYAGGMPTVSGNMAYLFGMGNLVITKPKIRYFYYK